MKKLNIVARSTWIPLKSNNIGIKVEGGHVIRSVMKKWKTMARSTRIPLKFNSKWDHSGRCSLLLKCSDF
jgi:hypothetical protein